MSGTLADKARGLATCLMHEQPDRLSHLTGVAARCEALSAAVPPAAVDALVAAGWLHDIGYLPLLGRTGFHPLDGALYLREHGWRDDICALVAHHSGSRFVARVRGLDETLGVFEFVEDESSDVLTVADNTALQDGSFITVSERLREKLARHGPNSPGALANPARDDYIRAASVRVRSRLAGHGRSDPYLA
ncbi:MULTISPECIES: HD domain-containing protein [Mycolicibacterium]|nr:MULTISPECIES: HD domain-containing protein [Mycolicibacterium]